MAGDDGTRSLSADRRAYVPFAVIGVLLLLTSVVVITAMETRSEPEVDTDAAQAYDRTTSAVQAALQDATTAGLERAAARPVTDPANGSPLGRTLADGDPRTPVGDPDPDEVFTRYAKLLVYLEVEERVASAGQDLGGDTVTRVDVGSPTHPADAIDAVTMQVGGDELNYGDPGSRDLQHGAVRVTIPDVEITVERDGQPVARRTENFTVTVGSPTFELHHLTDEYEAAMNTDLGDEEGFAAHLGARLYRLGYHRGYAQAEGAPLTDVLGERHLQALANDARFATQRDVFGNADGYGDRALTRSYGCMLAEDHHGVYDDPTGGSPDLSAVLDRVDEPGFCDGTNATYADVDVADATAPSFTDLAGPDDYLEETERLDLEQPARSALGDLETDGGIDAAIDRAYTVDVRVEGDLHETTIPVGEPDAENDELLVHDVYVTDHREVVDPDDDERDRTFHEFDVVWVGTYDRGGDDAIVRYDLTLSVHGEHGPNQHVDELGVDRDYEEGPYADPDVLGGVNYARVPDRALEEALAGVDDADRAASQLEDHLQDVDGVLTADDVVDAARAPGDASVTAEPRDREALRGWLLQDLRTLRAEFQSVDVSYRRHELVNGTEPLEALEADVAADDRVYEHVSGSTYENVPDKARAEARHAYRERLRAQLDRAIDRHEQTVERVDAELQGHSDAPLSNATAFARDQLTADPYRPDPDLPEHGLLQDVERIPDGEPTQLTFERVDETQVPALDGPPFGFASLSGRSAETFARPSDHDLPGRSTVTPVHLRTAGEVYAAANATDSVAGDPDWDDDRLEDLRGDLETELDGIAKETALRAQWPFPGIEPDALAEDVAAEIEALGPLERRAIHVAAGEDAIDRIAENVTDRYVSGLDPAYRSEDNPRFQYFYDDLREHLETSIRHGLRDAAGEGRVHGALADSTVEAADRVRGELDDATAAAIEERLEQAATDHVANGTATATEATWFESDDTDVDVAPNAVSAGLTTTNLPDWNLLTTNVWHVRLSGEYARFTVKAASRADGRPGTTEYVREAGTATVAWNGTEFAAGHVEPISFTSSTSLHVAAPADGLGIGERTTDADRWCSEHYPETGPILARPSPLGSSCPGP